MSPRPRGESLQERFAPTNRCFGCGPANPAGLGLRSFVGADGETLEAEFLPGPQHVAFGEVLHGGVIAALFDCHANWAAAHGRMRERNLEAPPATVTAELQVTFERPTPLLIPVKLVARALPAEGRRIVVESSLVAEGVLTARCRGTFVAVDDPQRRPGGH
ncbi:MAG: PaaI family thioesterase [Deltaproteobacteria bacterium]|nr:PaaI family thioesterase [Deltaproteobacteria bacterium]